MAICNCSSVLMFFIISATVLYFFVFKLPQVGQVEKFKVNSQYPLEQSRDPISISRKDFPIMIDMHISQFWKIEADVQNLASISGPVTEDSY
jgi:hypothetical protein